MMGKIVTVMKAIKKIFLIGFLVFYSAISYASLKHGIKYWATVEVNGTIAHDSKMLYLMGYQGHVDAKINNYERTLLYGGVGYQTLPNLSLWLGYQWNSKNHISGTNSENEIWEQAIWQLLQKQNININSRTRFEQIMMVGQSITSQRLRERIMLRFPKKFHADGTPVLYDEIFINLNNPAWTEDSNLLRQNRIFIGVDIQTSKRSTVEIGYINQFRWRNTGNSLNNILSLSLNVTT